MGRVYIERDAECSCSLCSLELAWYDRRHMPNHEAIQAAVNLLGIERDVVVIPRSLPRGTLGAAAGLDSQGRWIVYIDDTEVQDRSGQGFSYSLWHELGHVEDFERQLRAMPWMSWNQLHERIMRPYRALERIYPEHSPEFYETYKDIPTERYADDVARRYSHIPLEI